MSKKQKKDIPRGFEDFPQEKMKSCQACGGKLKLENVNLEEFEAGKLYLMENVSAYVCQNCGEIWVPEPILKEFEKMMEVAKARKKRRHPKKKKKA